MFGFDEAQDNYNQVNDSDNKAELSHELLAGGASFMAFKAFEDHQRNEGQPVSHQFAKELLAGFAGAEVDRLAETKGADYIDREKAKREAKRRAENLYDSHYGQMGDQFDPNTMQAPEHIQRSFGGGYGGGDGGYGGGNGGYGGGDSYGGGNGGGYGGGGYGGNDGRY